MKIWKTIKSKIVFECEYMKIIEEDFIMPSGNSDKYYMLQRLDFVVVIAKDRDNFYLVKQSRYTTKTRLTEFVAGAIEVGETSLKSAKRELEEEAGIKAKEFKNLGWYWANRGCSKQKGYVFLAEDLSFVNYKPDKMESAGKIETVKYKITEIKEMIKDGKINDNDSLAAFNLFMLKCNN